jgi:hypothetical protein
MGIATRPKEIVPEAIARALMVVES